MKVLIAGASGFIGSSLTKHLRSKGNEVVILTRKHEAGSIHWDPQKDLLDASLLEGFDAFINLAGESIATGRWTESKKAAIRESRLKSTLLLSSAIAKLQHPPKVLINASAVGFYGDQGEGIVDEASPSGKSFLASVCNEWEASTAPAKNTGTRVVLLRIGTVLAKKGGALARMLTPFSYGLGGRIGPGSQYMSWVSLNELINIIDFLLHNESLDGPVNAVSPYPVTNREFTKSLGKVLNRPTLIPFPAFMAKLIFGEMAEELLLSSTRVHPVRLQKAGYEYMEPNLENVLRRELLPKKH